MSEATLWHELLVVMANILATGRFVQRSGRLVWAIDPRIEPPFSLPPPERQSPHRAHCELPRNASLSEELNTQTSPIDMQAVWGEIEMLPDRSRAIMRLLYQENGERSTTTYKEVATAYGVTVERIRQIKARACRILRYRKHRYQTMQEVGKLKVGEYQVRLIQPKDQAA